MRRTNKKYIGAIVVLVVAMFLVSTFAAAISSGAPQSSQKNKLTLKKPDILSTVQNDEKLPLYQRVYQILKQDNVPLKYAYLPSMEKRFTYNGEQVTPLYSQAPAPMGLGDFGLKVNSTGQYVPYTYETSSFEGTVKMNNLMDFYMLDGSPYSVSIQLNTVLNHVTLFGNSSYVFWNQNVIFYSARTQELTFLDNIWNFSSSAFYMSPNSIYSGNGTLVPGVYYYAIGPTIHVTYPFTVNLFLNSTVINGDTAVFFNYTVIFSNGTQISGSYDRVLFNSTYGMPTGYVAPQPYYLVSGSEITPNGYLLNDAEIMIGGPGGGSTAMIYNINAMMNLYYYNSTTKSYNNVPAAFDFGTDTGETSEGVAVSWAGETATLNAGPSFLYGMWNASLSNKMEAFIGTVNPPNAFMFVSEGSSFNEPLATWVPLSNTGSYSYVLPYGNYSAYVLLSNYNPITVNSMPSNMVLRMVKNTNLGIYTPLYALSNYQVQFISSQGNGTANNPYVIYNNEYHPINPIFAQFNDYAYPAFAGVMILNTNVHILLNGMPSFEIVYPQSLYTFLNFYNMPGTNYLNYEFYNTTDLSLVNTQFISGWFSYELAWDPLLGSVIFWNSTHDLVANNQFSSMGISLTFYNNNATNSDNVIWGNYFMENSIVFSPIASYLTDGATPLGLVLYSGNNLIYNNYFNVQYPAYNPDFNAYWYVSAIYQNTWNISMEKLSYYRYFNGYNLTGNVLNTGYQGGNFWYNFNGQVPFNDLGLIQSGGDYLPLNFTQIPFTFEETGLAPGTWWYVEILNTANMLVENFTSNTSEITFYVVPGTYYALVGPVSGYAQNIYYNVYRVYIPEVINVVYSPLYNVTFFENGLPIGTTWTVIFNGYPYSSNSNSITISATAGNYSYQVMPIPGYIAKPTSGYVNVTNSSVSVNITFTQVLYNVTFIEKGLSSGTWAIEINGMIKNNSANEGITFNLPNGTYEFQVMQVNGYTSNIQSGFIYVNGSSLTENIVFSQVLVNVQFIESGLPSGTAWSIQINGHTYTTVSDILSLSLPYGTFTYNVVTPGYIGTPGSGSFTINGTPISIGITFKQALYTVTFVETGLPSGTSWSLNFAGSIYSVSGSSTSFSVPNGTYTFVINNVPGYNVTPSYGTVVVSGSIVTEQITFKVINYTITFVETGLPSGATWSVTLNGVTKSSSTNTIVFVVPYGKYSYTITLPSGYTSSVTSGNITANMVTVNPVLTAPAYSTGISALDIVLIIIVVILVIVVIVEAVYFTKMKKPKEGVKPWNEPKEPPKNE